MRKTIYLTENDLNNIVLETVNETLRRQQLNEMNAKQAALSAALFGSSLFGGGHKAQAARIDTPTDSIHTIMTQHAPEDDIASDTTFTTTVNGDLNSDFNEKDLPRKARKQLKKFDRETKNKLDSIDAEYERRIKDDEKNIGKHFDDKLDSIRSKYNNNGIDPEYAEKTDREYQDASTALDAHSKKLDDLNNYAKEHPINGPKAYKKAKQRAKELFGRNIFKK